MRLKVIKLFSLVSCLLVASVSLAATQEKVSLLLAEMSSAIRELNYEGRFMYMLGKEMSSFQIQHAVIDGQEHERLVFLNQKRQEVVRIGHDLFCVHTGSHLLRKHQSLSANPLNEKLEKLNAGVLDLYELAIIEHQMVAGRDATKVSFKAKDNNRFDHHLWIDTESKLLLKTDISEPMSGVLESFEYVQLKLNADIPLSEFKHQGFVRHQPKHFMPIKHEAGKPSRKLKHDLWELVWLPEGFYFSGSGQTLGKNEQTIEMLMFTDGLASITIFIEAIDKAPQFSESSQKGALAAYSQPFKKAEQNFMITAVGEVQLHTLERIAKGLKAK